MLDIKCDNCGSIGKMSLLEGSYEGPYRCWKCRSPFIIKIENNELQLCKPISEEEFETLFDESNA